MSTFHICIKLQVKISHISDKRRTFFFLQEMHSSMKLIPVQDQTLTCRVAHMYSIIYVVHWFRFILVGFCSLSRSQNPSQGNKNQTCLEHVSRNKLNQWIP